MVGHVRFYEHNVKPVCSLEAGKLLISCSRKILPHDVTDFIIRG